MRLAVCGPTLNGTVEAAVMFSILLRKIKYSVSMGACSTMIRELSRQDIGATCCDIFFEYYTAIRDEESFNFTTHEL